MEPPRENWMNSICVNLTNRCDTYCKYCYQESTSKKSDYIGLKDLKKVLDFFHKKTASSTSDKYFQLTGGEITLHPDFFDIIDMVLSYGFILRLQTNAIGISSIPRHLLKKLSSPKVMIKVSLDGWNAQTHEYLRAKGTFEKVINGIKTLKSFNEKIGIKTVIHSTNLPGIHKMLDLCKDLDVKGFGYNLLAKKGRAKTMPVDIIDELEVAKKLIPYFNLKEYQYLLNGNNILLYYLLPTPEMTTDGIFFINYEGGIYPNQFFRKEEKIGSIFGENLDSEFDISKVKTRKIPIDAALYEYVKQNLVIETTGAS